MIRYVIVWADTGDWYEEMPEDGYPTKEEAEAMCPDRCIVIAYNPRAQEYTTD